MLNSIGRNFCNNFPIHMAIEFNGIKTAAKSILPFSLGGVFFKGLSELSTIQPCENVAFIASKVSSAFMYIFVIGGVLNFVYQMNQKEKRIENKKIEGIKMKIEINEEERDFLERLCKKAESYALRNREHKLSYKNSYDNDAESISILRKKFKKEKEEVISETSS